MRANDALYLFYSLNNKGGRWSAAISPPFMDTEMCWRYLYVDSNPSVADKEPHLHLALVHTFPASKAHPATEELYKPAKAQVVY